MPIDSLLTLPCTITRAAWDNVTVDEFGNPTLTTTSSSTVCELQQTRRDETTALGQLGEETWTLFLPADTDIGLADTVLADGHTYELFGPPWPVRHPRTGVESHIECTVRRTAGTGEG